MDKLAIEELQQRIGQGCLLNIIGTWMQKKVR